MVSFWSSSTLLECFSPCTVSSEWVGTGLGGPVTFEPLRSREEVLA